MRLLLDTHAFLWAASDTPKLSPTAQALIEDSQNELLLSIASVWEISIKYGLGKLALPQAPVEFTRSQMQDIGFVLLPIELHHIALIATLPLHHRDPFDRMLVAQDLAEGLPIVSADAVLDAYGGTRLW